MASSSKKPTATVILDMPPPTAGLVAADSKQAPTSSMLVDNFRARVRLGRFPTGRRKTWTSKKKPTSLIPHHKQFPLHIKWRCSCGEDVSGGDFFWSGHWKTCRTMTDADLQYCKAAQTKLKVTGQYCPDYVGGGGGGEESDIF